MFNENAYLKKENDEKDKLLSDKSTQIFSLQAKLTSLTTEIQNLKLKKTLFQTSSDNSKDSPKESPLLKPSLKNAQEASSLNPIKIKRSSKEKLGFIDKHIIKPIRGGNSHNYHV